MRRFAALCIKEWLLLSRDRHGLLVLFAVPTLFILIMSLALRDAFDPHSQPRLRIELIDHDHGALASELEERLRQLPGLDLTADETDPVQLVIPKGFSELLAARNRLVDHYLKGIAEPDLLQLNFAPTVTPQGKATATLAIRETLQAVQGDYLLGTVFQLPPDQLAAMRYLNDPQRLPIAVAFVAEDGVALRAPTSVQQNVPAWLIFAIFFTVIPLATTFVTERSQGSLLRLRALDVGAFELFASKALPYYCVNLLQIALMLAIGVWLVPLLGGDRLGLGHSALGLWLIGSATSIAAIGLALLVAVSVRTTMQATIAGGALSLLFAAIGGIMVPKLVMSPAMQALTWLSPMAWSLEGFWDIVLRQGSWTAPLGESAALLALGMASLVLAGLIYRRQH